MSESPLKIANDELFTPRIQEYIDIQDGLTRHLEAEPEHWVKRLLYSNWFYLMIWGGVGAFLGWALLEPYYDDSIARENDDPELVAYLLFPVVAGAVGLFLGSAEGIMCRNVGRAITSGAVGLGVGFVGGLVALIPTGMFFILMTGVAMSMWENPQPDQMPSGLALLVFMFGRAGAWAIVSIPAGLGQGIAQRERKVIFNGLLGAVLGGFIGGFVFDPIDLLFGDGEQAWLSRMVGLTFIGLAVGLFIGLVEGWTKTAWLHMRKGPLAGKQFILFKDTTVLGSSPKAEVYLFKDEAIEPRHAIIYNRGGRFEIEDCGTDDGTYVNGVALKAKRFLQTGDQVVLGKTVLEFAFKQADA